MVYREDQFRDEYNEYTEDDYLNSSFGPNVGHRFKDFVNPDKDQNNSNKVKKKIPVTESFTDSDSLDDMIRYSITMI